MNNDENTSHFAPFFMEANTNTQGVDLTVYFSGGRVCMWIVPTLVCPF